MRPMILGFVLSAPDNDSYMLRRATDDQRCSECSTVVDHDWVDTAFTLTDRGWDISYTYDGYCIVSQRFRDHVRDRGASYVALPAEPSFFALFATESVEFDAQRRRTRFENFCEECERFTDVAGATPVFLKEREPLPNKLRRTDIEFGSGDERRPLLLVGPDLGAELRAAELVGLELTAVNDG
jgi:hypothetical protein